MTLLYTLKHQWIDTAHVARFIYTNPDERGNEETPVAVMLNGDVHELDTDDFNLHAWASNAHMFPMLLVDPEGDEGDSFWVPVGDVRQIRPHPDKGSFTVILTDGSSMVSNKHYVYQCFPNLAHPLHC